MPSGRNLLLFLSLTFLASPAARSQPRELSLADAVEQALALSPQIQIAKLRTLETRGQYGVVRSGYLPQLTASAVNSVQTSNLRGIGLSFPGVPARIGPFQVFDARPRLSQTVFSFSLIQDMAAARRRIQQADFDAQSLREAVLLGVVDLYLRALLADSRVRATQARLESAAALRKQAKDFLEVGTGNRLDFVRAENQFETETATLAQNQRDRATTVLLLLETIGLPVETEVRLTERLMLEDLAAPPVEQAERAALEARPEVRAVQAKLEAARFSVSSARAQRLPTVRFSADYGVIGERIGRNLSTYTVAGAVELPVFQGGRIQAEVASAKSRFQQVEQEVREVENQVKLDVRTAAIQVDSAQQAAQAASRAAAAATEAVELAQLRFEAGLTAYVDVVTAQQERARADDLETATLYDFYLARVNLARAAGDVAGFLD